MAIVHNATGEDAPSVPRDAWWGSAFVGAFVVLQCFKIALAVRLAPFADEAFYWQESRHLAWGYSDLPGVTAWLIRAGQELGGMGVLAMRAPFLLLGALLPWLVVAWARRHGGPRCGWQAGLLALGMPLVGTLGALALPDVPLTVAAMLALLALDRAASGGRWLNWLALGAALALAVATHYRAAMLLFAGLVFAFATPRGRALWRVPGWYAALGLGALGSVPLLIYNASHAWVGVAFQAVQRNPWQFHADALRQPLEQALVVTPLLYALLLWATWRAWRRRGDGAPWDLAGAMGGVFIVGYFGAGLFADDLRFRLHWPLPGYLPLLALVPALLAARARPRVWAVSVAATLAAGQIATCGVLWAAGSSGDSASEWRDNGVGRAFAGWRATDAMVVRALQAAPGAVLVADNFKLGAELDFALHGARPVYVLDSPANVKHGRQPQLSAWRRDSTSLATRHAGATVLLAVEETSLREAARPAWLGSLCDRFSDLQPVARVDLPRLDHRVALYRGQVRPTPHADPRGRDACLVWMRAWRAAYPAAG